MKKGLLSLVAVLSIAGTSAVAADMNKWYVQGDIGYGWASDAGLKNVVTSGTDSQLLFSTLDKLGKSPSFGVAAGYNINENIRAELAVTMRNGFEVKDTDSSTLLPTDYYFSGDIKSTAVMANAYYTWNKLPVSPYIGLGLGYSHNKVNSLTSIAADGSDMGKSDGGTSSNFAYQLMLGFDYKINNNWTIDIGYRYADLGKIETKSGTAEFINLITGVPGTAVLDGSKGDLKVHEAKLGIRYNF